MMHQELLDQAVAAIAAADSLTLACHVGPDGDALGSMLALAAAATDAGKKVWPTFGQPFDPPETLRFLPLDLLVPPDEVPKDPPVFVAFDTGSADRLGEVARVAKQAGTVIVVDHHVTNEGFGDIALVEPGLSSTAELTLAVIQRLGWPVTPVVATCLLTGIVTDTGRFQYSNTRPPTLLAAAKLVAAGARPEIIGQHVYDEAPFGYLSVVSAVLGRAVLELDRRLVWSVVVPADLASAGVDKGDVDGLIDLIRLPRESDVAVLVKVVDDKVVKVSLRSRGRVDVGAIAAELDGGGHHNASGFTFTGSAEAAIEEIRKRLPND